MRVRKRRRRIAGLVPRIGQWLLALGRRLAPSPKPFILLSLLAIALWALWGYAQRSDAFRIAQVSLPQNASFTLRESLLNANLWELDLHRLADELKQQQPWLREVRIVRQLPNTIRVDAIPRIPVAQVRIDRWYPVDGEGFVLPHGSAEPAEHLIRMSGFERGPALTAGKEHADARLQLALRLLEKWRRAPASLSRRLTEINVADPQRIRFIINFASQNEVEVRCGSEPELDAHLKRLQAALKAVMKHPLTVKYIDVRFPEPVIGPRT